MKLSELSKGEMFELYEDCIARKNAFPHQVRFKTYNNDVFEVIKKNKKTVRVKIIESSKPPHRGMKFDLKFQGTDHWRSASKDSKVNLV